MDRRRPTEKEQECLVAMGFFFFKEEMHLKSSFLYKLDINHVLGALECRTEETL